MPQSRSTAYPRHQTGSHEEQIKTNQTPHMKQMTHKEELQRRKHLTKHAYSNKLTNSPPKTGKFSNKNSAIFHSSAQNIGCRYSLEPHCQGGSKECPQSMFLSRYIYIYIYIYPYKSQFYFIKVGFKGVKIM